MKSILVHGCHYFENNKFVHVILTVIFVGCIRYVLKPLRRVRTGRRAKCVEGT